MQDDTSKKVSEDTWSQVYDYLIGTANTADGAIERFGLNCDIDDVEEAMEDRNLECCPTCGWWVETHELLDDDTDDVLDTCSNCRD